MFNGGGGGGGANVVESHIHINILPMALPDVPLQ